ncbi:MAG: TonB family protein [Tenuifilaceae bacterium]|jgi:protein TonB|nr:TonB family protein [Bacteroidales bacterium]MDI9515392.1 TonB family protein [Bacteroidota bacterium]OQC62856.1 MAG: Gram-negative bacterial tonB protein [Bacteroidetes bacterium ADurb.Bin008]HNV81799.1 TonB family protein [Tenuifilaceae bacterium]MZP81526.1 TonB family protein [Bacteroidales bacterium]
MKPKIDIPNKSSQCIAQEVLIAYLQGRLTGVEMNRVERHLAVCPMCADELEGLSLLDSPQSMDAMVERVHRAIDEKVGTTPRRIGVPFYLKIAAALLVLISISALIYHSLSRISQPLEIAEQLSVKEEKKSEHAAPAAIPEPPTSPASTTEVETQEETVREQKVEKNQNVPPPPTAITVINDDMAVIDDMVDISDEEELFQYGQAADSGIARPQAAEVSTDKEEIVPIAELAAVPPPPRPMPSAGQVSSKRRPKQALRHKAVGNIDLDDAEHPLATEDNDEAMVKIVTFAKEEEDVEEKEIFIVVEEMPVFEGGDINAFRNYIAKSIKYPESAAENGIQGKVIVSFIVEADGKVTNVKVVRGIDPALDQEAVRVIESSPKWQPGKQRGKPVRVNLTFPVVFKLE